ncbi:Uma2 family endonuclease [Trichothermofontia sp.]
MVSTLLPNRDRFATPPADRILLKNIRWQTYQDLVQDLEQEPGIRLTYDHGFLEIYMPLDPHETYKKQIGRLVEALTEELGIEIRSLGSRTWGQEALARGLEADQCYYIQNEATVRGKPVLDLSQDPPPDLAIEIDITSPSLNQLAIYAALGIPEVWIFDGTTLTIYCLSAENYEICPISPTFPQLPPAQVVYFLKLAETMGETTWIRTFRQWIREYLGGV